MVPVQAAILYRQETDVDNYISLVYIYSNVLFNIFWQLSNVYILLFRFNYENKSFFFFSSLYFLIIETNKLYEQIVFEEIRKNFSRFDFRWKTTLDNSQYWINCFFFTRSRHWHWCNSLEIEKRSTNIITNNNNTKKNQKTTTRHACSFFFLILLMYYAWENSHSCFSLNVIELTLKLLSRVCLDR